MAASIAPIAPVRERGRPSTRTASAVLTHHWLVRCRGGEKVLEALGELLPEADIYTLVYDRRGMGDSPLAQRRVHTSMLQSLPGGTRHYPRLLPLLPWAARRIHLPDVDLVVCSDASVAKAMQPAPSSTVVCYCHSPMRYAYESALRREYGETLPWPARPFWAPVTAIARRIDRRAARGVDLFVANSAHVASRIERFYGRRAVVVFPPVDVPAGPTIGPRGDGYLCVGYHTRYKRLDLAVEACRLLGRRLTVIGDGPELGRLQARRDPHVDVLGWQPNAVLHEHLARARGLLFPGEEDFGIVPVEAFARGCPVAAYAVGGATETVVPGVTGVWFERQTVDALVDAMRRLEAITFDPERMHREACRFGRDRFLTEMRDVLDGALEGRLRS